MVHGLRARHDALHLLCWGFEVIDFIKGGRGYLPQGVCLNVVGYVEMLGQNPLQGFQAKVKSCVIIGHVPWVYSFVHSSRHHSFEILVEPILILEQNGISFCVILNQRNNVSDKLKEGCSNPNLILSCNNTRPHLWKLREHVDGLVDIVAVALAQLIVILWLPCKIL